MNKIDEIGSTEYIRAHIQKLNERDKAKGETRGVDGATLLFKGPSRDATNATFTEMDRSAKQHMQEIGACLR